MKRFLAAFLVLCMAFIINSVQVYGAQDDTQTMWEPEDGDEQVQEEAELPKTEEASESLPGEAAAEPAEREETSGYEETRPEENAEITPEPEEFMSSKTKAGWEKDTDGKIRYQNADGSYPDGWKKIGAYWYYFDEDGWLETGWITLTSGTYYLTESGEPGAIGAMLTGWQNIAGTVYYFDESGPAEGKMHTGWMNTSYRRFYFKESGSDIGKLMTGWQTIGKNTYYFQMGGNLGERGRLYTEIGRAHV